MSDVRIESFTWVCNCGREQLLETPIGDTTAAPEVELVCRHCGYMGKTFLVVTPRPLQAKEPVETETDSVSNDD